MKIEPVSLAEIGDMTGLTRQKLASLKYHNKLPQAAVTLKCGPLWDFDKIKSFCEETKLGPNFN